MEKLTSFDQTETPLMAQSTEPMAPPPHHKSTLPIIIGFLVVAVLIGGVGYFLGSKQSKVSDALDNVATVPVASLSPLPASSPLLPSVEQSDSWVRKQYISNNRVVWDILQPVQTTANQGGLHEGYLGLKTSEDGNQIMAELSYPIFTEYLPTTMDEWLKHYLDNELTESYVDRSVETLIHPQAVDVRMIKTTFLSPGGGVYRRTPKIFVLIWRKSDQEGVEKKSLITVQPDEDDEISEVALQAFVRKLVQGINFE